MTNDSTSNLSVRDLEILIGNLDVQFVWLSHCLVSRGYRLDLGGIDFPGIHYNIHGNGRLVVRGRHSVDLEPHTLVIVPPNSPFTIEVPGDRQRPEDLQTVSAMDVVEKKNEIYQFVAGDALEAQINLVCGFFRASYGQTTDLFGELNEPIIEKFGPEAQIGPRLRSAVAEFLSHEVGSDAMSAALLKQVIILLLRRSLACSGVWMERFHIFRDPRIARAFAAMVADPGADHTLKSLAAIALMSRSAFVSTFGAIVGKTPMATLRDLRMRHAAQLLKYSHLDIDQVSQQSGYENKTSFTRAFRETYGKLPIEYRAEFADTDTGNGDCPDK